MISTNFIIGTGFIKVHSDYFSGTLCSQAILVIEIDEVLVARIQFSGKFIHLLENFQLQILVFCCSFYIKSAFPQASESCESSNIFKSFCFCSSVRLPFAIILSKLVVMVLIPLSKNASSKHLPNLL